MYELVELSEHNLESFVELTEAFFNESGHHGLGFNPTRVSGLLRAIKLSPDAYGVLCVRDTVPIGCIYGSNMPVWYSDQDAAMVFVWYVKPEHRKSVASYKLLKEFETWAKEVGADVISLGGLNKSAESVFEKRGFVRTETIYSKEL